MRRARLGAATLAAAVIGGPIRPVAAPTHGMIADSTMIVLLGTGTPRPDPEASGPATAIVVGARTFLFDAGPGVERQLNAARLPINGVTALFITHLHSDHTLGLPDLIFTSWVMGRKAPMQAYGPRGLRAMVDHILAAWSEDIAIRTNGLEHETANGYAVAVHEIAPGVVYDSGGVRVTAIPVLHGDWKGRVRLPHRHADAVDRDLGRYPAEPRADRGGTRRRCADPRGLSRDETRAGSAARRRGLAEVHAGISYVGCRIGTDRGGGETEAADPSACRGPSRRDGRRSHRRRSQRRVCREGGGRQGPATVLTTFTFRLSFPYVSPLC